MHVEGTVGLSGAPGAGAWLRWKGSPPVGFLVLCTM